MKRYDWLTNNLIKIDPGHIDIAVGDGDILAVIREGINRSEMRDDRVDHILIHPADMRSLLLSDLMYSGAMNMPGVGGRVDTIYGVKLVVSPYCEPGTAYFRSNQSNTQFPLSYK